MQHAEELMWQMLNMEKEIKQSLGEKSVNWKMLPLDGDMENQMY